MYHRNDNKTLSLPGDLQEIQHAYVLETEGKKVLHMAVELRPDKELCDDETIRLHMTDGVTHTYYDQVMNYEKAKEELLKSIASEEEILGAAEKALSPEEENKPEMKRGEKGKK